MSDRKQQLLKTLEAQLAAKRTNKLRSFVPYPKQGDFFELGATKRERLLMAGTQLGKSEAGAFECAVHLTGDYPTWWTGRRFDHPVTAWAAGVSSVAVRDIQQKKLCGTPGVEADWGTGMIPKTALLDKSASHGAPDAIDTLHVRHASGGTSTLAFKSYEQGREKFQGATLDFAWLDEEPDMSLYGEALARTVATKGMVYLTFTPLLGLSDVVLRFLNEPSPDRAVVQMGIKDALHFTEEERQRTIASYPAHEREARANGVPMLGSGKVFTTPESEITVAPFEPPDHWRYMWAIDPGMDHPFAAVLLAWNVDADALYVTHTIRMKDALPLQHAYAMKSVLHGFGAKVPVSWPQDATQRKEFEGRLEPLAKIYRAHGLNMCASHAAFADGSNSTELGILHMQERFSTNRLKVFSSCTDWFEEYRLYHRKDGKLVKVRDDLLSATRVGVMAHRFARAVLFDPYRGQSRRDGGNVPMARDLDIDPFGSYGNY